MTSISTIHSYDPGAQIASPLFKLPGELRNQIWAYVLGGRKLFFTQTAKHERGDTECSEPPRWKLENDFGPEEERVPGLNEGFGPAPAVTCEDFLGHDIDVSLRLTCKQAYVQKCCDEEHDFDADSSLSAAEGRKALYVDNHIFLDTTRISLFDDVWEWPSLAQWPIDKAQMITVPLLSRCKLELDPRLRLLGPYLKKPECSITIVAHALANVPSEVDPERWGSINETFENIASPGLFKAYVRVAFFREEHLNFGPPFNKGLLNVFANSCDSLKYARSALWEFTYND